MENDAPSGGVIEAGVGMEGHLFIKVIRKKKSLWEWITYILKGIR